MRCLSKFGQMRRLITARLTLSAAEMQSCESRFWRYSLWVYVGILETEGDKCMSVWSVQTVTLCTLGSIAKLLVTSLLHHWSFDNIRL